MIAAVTIAYAALFIACAVTDIMQLRIPNVLVAALLALFVVVCILSPPESPESIVWNHIAPGLVVFILAAIPFYFDKLGGGDVKLLGATAMWVGVGSLGVFFISLALYGALAILVFSVFRHRIVALLAWASERLGRAIPAPASLLTGNSIPYGVVIAAAALTVGPGLFGVAR